MRGWLWTALLGVLVAGIGAPAARAESEDYRIGPGDVIEVTVAPQSKFDRTVTVQPDGKLSFPLVGQTQAAGLTVAQLQEKLRQGLDRELVDPQVTVSLKEWNKKAAGRVSLYGAVRSPNGYEIKDGTTVAELITSAGGPTPKADLHRVTITRGDHSVLTVDLSQTETTGRLERDVVLKPGDFVVVPEGGSPTVMVVGEVTKPGPVTIEGGARLMDAIALAGGPTPKADWRRVTLARQGAEKQTLDLEPLMRQGDTSKAALNAPLQPGDTILLPETDQQVYVFGRVVKPDIYPLKPNERVLDVLLQAGGAAGDGDISKAVLVRRGENGQPVPKPLDLKKIIQKADMSENELLRPGDLLFVPDKKTRRPAGEILNLLYPLTGLLGFFRIR